MSKVTILTRPNRIVIASKGVQGPPGPEGEQGIPDAPDDGGAYIRVNGAWVQLYAPLALAGDLPDGTVGDPYTATLGASGGRPPYALGDVLLPPGLDATLADTTVTVAGTPTEEWEGDAHIDLSDALGTALRSVFDVGVRDSSPSSLFAIRSAIEAGANDVAILAVGDSTGDQTSEWVYLFGQWLAAQYPTHSVDYLLFDFPSNAYGAPTAISTGSGDRKITIYNGHVGDTQPMSIAGDRFANIVGAVSPDVMLVSYGHNLATASSVLDNPYTSLVEMMLLAHPGVPLGMVLQNPNRDDNSQASKIAAVRKLVADHGDLDTFNAYDKFLALGKDGSLYNDIHHPSPAGSSLYVEAVTDRWQAATEAAASSPVAWLADNAANLLLNGDFSAFGSSVPDSWTQIGGALSKDTTVKAPGSAYSVRIDSTSEAARIQQAISGAALDALKGKTVSLAVLESRASSPIYATVGRIAVAVSGPSAWTVNCYDHSSTYAPGTQGGFYWNILRGLLIPADATALTISLRAAPSTLAAGTYTAWFDRAVLVEGDFPRNMA